MGIRYCPTYGLVGQPVFLTKICSISIFSVLFPFWKKNDLFAYLLGNYRIFKAFRDTENYFHQLTEGWGLHIIKSDKSEIFLLKRTWKKKCTKFLACFFQLIIKLLIKTWASSQLTTCRPPHSIRAVSILFIVHIVAQCSKKNMNKFSNSSDFYFSRYNWTKMGKILYIWQE